MRTLYPTTRNTLLGHFKYICQSEYCRLLGVWFGDGYVVFLVDQNTTVALNDFIYKIKRWSSDWILSKGSGVETKGCYWANGCYVRTISPEDREKVIKYVETNVAAEGFKEFAKKSRMKYSEVVSADDDMVPIISICHHIIIITSRSRLLIPKKYFSLLSELVVGVVKSFGYNTVACASMRNHIHILCRVPFNVDLASVIGRISVELLKCMHANRHFRRFEGWSENSLVFSVSENKIVEEEYIILNQDMVHWRNKGANEMSYLYQRLRIPFFSSLH